MSSVIERQTTWNRCLAIVEEQAQVLQRTAVSMIVCESGDLAAGLFDAQGRMMAQAVTGTPGHINSMALATGHVNAAHPVETMQPATYSCTTIPGSAPDTLTISPSPHPSSKTAASSGCSPAIPT